MARLMAPFALVDQQPTTDARLAELKRDLRASQELIVQEHKHVTRGIRIVRGRGTTAGGQRSLMACRDMTAAKMRRAYSDYQTKAMRIKAPAGRMRA